MTTYVNVRGTIIEQAFQKMPFLEWTYSDFEKNYEVNDLHQVSGDEERSEELRTGLS